MSSKFICENCGKDIIFENLKPGEIVKCGSCGNENKIPENKEELVKYEETSTINEKHIDRKTQGAVIHCSKCRKEFSLKSLETLISVKPEKDLYWYCPDCNTKNSQKIGIGCHFCLKNFYICSVLLNNMIECPHCKNEIELPNDEHWEEIVEEEKEFKWKVFSSENKSQILFKSREDIIDAIKTNKVKGSDLCQVHRFSTFKPLRDICNKYPIIRKLYDPVWFYKRRCGMILGTIFAILSSIAWLIGGTMAMGGKFLLSALFGLLAIVATPTVIGLFIVFLISHAVGIQLLGAYIGFILVGLTIASIYFLGYFIGKSIISLLVKPFNMDKGKIEF